MSETAKRVMQNSIVRVGGYTIGAALYFAIIILIARYLGTEGFGHFAFISAFVGIFQLVVDMGVRNILMRDIAVDKAHFAEKLGVARTLLWILSFISMSLVVLFANVLHLSDEVRQSTYLAGIGVILTFCALAYSAVLRAFEEMEWDILGFVLHKLVCMGLVWFVINRDLGLKGVFGAMLVANGFLFLYHWRLVTIRHGQAPLSLDLAAAWTLFTESFPLGVAEVLRSLTWQVDKLLLASLASPIALGLFSAAFKIIESVNPFTVNLTLCLFPAFSRLAQASSIKALAAFEQSLKFFFIMGIPLAIILFVFSDRAVVLFFGEAYRESSVVLKLLAPVVILLFPTAVYSYLFTALARQAAYARCVTISLGAKIFLNLLLIPFYSYVGAAVATLAAESILFLSGLIMLRRGSGLPSLESVWRPSLAGLGMGFLCWQVKDAVPISLAVGVLSAFAVYVVLLFALQTFTRQEVALVRDAMRIRAGSVTP